PPGGCPPFERGNFSIDAYQLYPENMDWDSELCQVYIGILFNGSFGIYDPYGDKLDVVRFPGYSLDAAIHMGGVGWDARTGLASAIVGQGNAFNTAGAVVGGDNLLKKYDPRTRAVVWTVNLTATTQGAYGGFNDVAHDPAGNTYVCGTFPSSILRVDARGTHVTAWYPPAEPVDHTVRGFSGIVAHGITLVALDSGAGKLVRFDATAATAGTGVVVPVAPNVSIAGGDAIHLPAKFGGRVMLVAEHAAGVAVLRSRGGDGDASWTAAEHLGVVPNSVAALPPGALVVSTTQIGDRLYIVNDWFADPVVSGTVAGNKTAFPMVDITRQVDELL
ncbi:hypothetical protein B0T26DRAFT_623183, partial [Lasiosphaeria miniovina]